MQCLVAFGVEYDLLVLSHALSAGNAAAGATAQEQLREVMRAYPECGVSEAVEAGGGEEGAAGEGGEEDEYAEAENDGALVADEEAAGEEEED